jgi:hypothetical protein
MSMDIVPVKSLSRTGTRMLTSPDAYIIGRGRVAWSTTG